jgi:lipoprotein-anchoring transpeptidase ErfK/SrfK
VRRVELLLSILVGLALTGALAGGVRAEGTPPGTIPEGVTIAAVAVGGMTPEAATAAVEQAFAVPLELDVRTTRVLVTPDLLGATATVQTAVERALAAVPSTAVPLPVTVDRAVLSRFIAQLGKRFDRAALDARLFLRDQRPFITREKAGHKLDQRKAVRDVAAALAATTRAPVRLVLKPVKASVTRAGFGAVIVIHRGGNRLLLYRGMRYWRSFAVATGQHAYPTPLGRFTIVVKWRNPWWYPPASPWATGQKPIPPGPDNPLGTRWMGLSAPGVGIHGTPSDGSIGYSVSHGCIRMHIPEAEWLFNHVDIGTTVFIVPD